MQHGQVCMLVIYGTAWPALPALDGFNTLALTPPLPPAQHGPAIPSNTALPELHMVDVHGPSSTPGPAVAQLAEGPGPLCAGADVVPPVGMECTLPVGFVEAYGVKSTRVLTTSEAPAWWVEWQGLC
jgi:hypothetical protein